MSPYSRQENQKRRKNVFGGKNSRGSFSVKGNCNFTKGRGLILACNLVSVGENERGKKKRPRKKTRKDYRKRRLDSRSEKGSR